MNDFDIPIFKKTYDFYRALYGVLQQFPRKDRYSLGQKCETALLNTLEFLWKASISKNKSKLVYLNEANVQINMIKIYLRLSKDIKAISLKKYSNLQEKIDEIGRMLGGWIKATEKKIT